MKSFYTPFFILLGFLSWFPSDTVFAQAPQYNYTPNSITNNAFPLNSSSSNCRQNLYYPADFNAPSGTIDKIYIGGIATSPTFTTLTIKMGPSALTTFTAGPFVSGLTTVFSNTVSPTLNAAGWYEIFLTTPYSYDNTMNLIIEVSQAGFSGSGSSPCASNSAVPSTINRTLAGNATTGTGSLQARLMKMGFDISPLSLDILSFTAVRKGDNIDLTWVTSNEKNISRFAIERSLDATVFSSIAELHARGGEMQQRYQATDVAVNNDGGKIYYRLKIVEDNGSFYYSPTVATGQKASNQGIVNIYPTVFTDKLFLTVSAESEGDALFTLVDISGRKVVEYKEFLRPGIQNVTIPNLSGLSSGLYLLSMELNHNVYTHRVNK